MGGGDYDGDTVVVIFEPTIVSSFKPQPLLPGDLCLGDPPEGFIEQNFNKSSELIREFLASEKAKVEGETTKKYKEVVLSSLEKRFRIGQYSKM